MQTLPKKIHVVAFDVPYPADYGGVIDIYHKVEALHHQGIEVILHMYQYGREESKTKLRKIQKHFITINEGRSKIHLWALLPIL